MEKAFRKISILLIAASLAFALISCESTKQESQKVEGEEQTGKNSETPTPNQSAKTIDDDLRSLLENMQITVVSSPKETTKGKAFSAPYKILVATLDGIPCEGASITAEYPSGRSADSVSFEKVTLISDESGHCEFVPPVPNFSIKSSVTFLPQISSSNPELVRLCQNVSVNAAWNVRTNTNSRSGILVSVVDYSQDGKMIVGGGSQPSTQALTAALWKSGLMGAQNADFHNSVDADDSARIQADAKRLVSGNTTFRYVVYGRVKYAEKMSQDAQGNWIVSLKGDVGALELATGKVLLKANKSVSVKDKSQWNALKNAQEEMARQFAEEIVYGL
ncbi:MAG: hypothetical protein K2N58_04685 [Treponemataceae bacterium]|nr:hypothetical protein [Treponemataceae bacterium]